MGPIRASSACTIASPSELSVGTDHNLLEAQSSRAYRPSSVQMERRPRTAGELSFPTDSTGSQSTSKRASLFLHGKGQKYDAGWDDNGRPNKLDGFDAYVQAAVQLRESQGIDAKSNPSRIRRSRSLGRVAAAARFEAGRDGGCGVTVTGSCGEPEADDAARSEHINLDRLPASDRQPVRRSKTLNRLDKATGGVMNVDEMQALSLPLRPSTSSGVLRPSPSSHFNTGGVLSGAHPGMAAVSSFRVVAGTV
eukprot:scaffold146932_cov39-Prasinocladus_malaysianus.AAC.3